MMLLFPNGDGESFDLARGTVVSEELGTCEVALRHNIHVEDATCLMEIARSFREDSVTSSEIITKVMAADLEYGTEGVFIDDVVVDTKRIGCEP